MPAAANACCWLSVEDCRCALAGEHISGPGNTPRPVEGAFVSHLLHVREVCCDA